MPRAVPLPGDLRPRHPQLPDRAGRSAPGHRDTAGSHRARRTWWHRTPDPPVRRKPPTTWRFGRVPTTPAPAARTRSGRSRCPGGSRCGKRLTNPVRDPVTAILGVRGIGPGMDRSLIRTKSMGDPRGGRAKQSGEPAGKAVPLILRGAPDHREDVISAIARDRSVKIRELMSPGYGDRPVTARPAAVTGRPGVPAGQADVTDAPTHAGPPTVVGPSGHAGSVEAARQAGWGSGRPARERAPAPGPPRRAVEQEHPSGTEEQEHPSGAEHTVAVAETGREASDRTVPQARRHPMQPASEPERSTRGGPGSPGLGSGGVPRLGSFAGPSGHARRAAAPGLPRGPSAHAPAVPALAVPTQPG